MFNRTNLSTDSPNHKRENSFNQNTKKSVETLIVYLCVSKGFLHVICLKTSV